MQATPPEIIPLSLHDDSSDLGVLAPPPPPRTTSKSTANYPPLSHPCITMSFLNICWHPLILLGPVVQRPISANPGLNFNPGCFLSLFKSLFRTIFLLFRAANYQLVDKNSWCGFSLKLSDLKSNFTLTLGYLKPALNNSAVGEEGHNESKVEWVVL